MRIFVISISLLLISVMGFGQDFKVPELTLEQKHDRTLQLTYATIITGIAAGKEAGMSVADYAGFCGDRFATTWNKEAGFNGLVGGFLYNWENWRRNKDPEVVIVEQSESKLVAKWYVNLKEMFSQGPVFGVSYEETLLWFEIISQKIAEYMGATYEHKLLEGDWLQATLMKKG